MDTPHLFGVLLLGVGLLGIVLGVGFLPGAGMVLFGIATFVDPPLRHGLLGLGVVVLAFTALSL